MMFDWYMVDNDIIHQSNTIKYHIKQQKFGKFQLKIDTQFCLIGVRLS